MKLIYLSAPYTTGPESTTERQTAIDKATAWLMEHSGAYIFSPITYEKPLKDVYGANRDWDFWGPKDAEMVARCDELWVLCLNNWENSKGVRFEIDEAHKFNKPVFYITVNTEKNIITFQDEIKVMVEITELGFNA
jgi:hypothetical protein